jgi:hypothetical protein
MRDLIDIVNGKATPQALVEDSRFGLFSQLDKMVTEKTWRPKRRLSESSLKVIGLRESDDEEKKTCPDCDGTGQLRGPSPFYKAGGGPMEGAPKTHKCDKCKGTGKVKKEAVKEFFDYDDGQDPLPEKSHEEQGQYHANEMERWQAQKGKHHPMTKSHRNAMHAHARANVEPHPERAKHLSKMAWDLSDMIARPDNPNMRESFKGVQAKIEKKEHVSKDAAGAILASSSRNASKSAKAKNPKLKKVRG